MRVRLRLAPSGQGCRHVHIESLDGKVLDVLSRDSWAADDDDQEPTVRRQVKQAIRRYLRSNPNANPQQVKAHVEGEDL